MTMDMVMDMATGMVMEEISLMVTNMKVATVSSTCHQLIRDAIFKLQLLTTSLKILLKQTKVITRVEIKR